ncbi:hypothetical protein P301_O10501 [Saccharomyces cerevisiae P301]|uniref:EC1118_1O4_0870p n=2 Tax=Saccharomyces cerevisiae TaxID=4932 RepID=C8ZHN1_YEAS8|nr:hypothetical protein R008_O10566 [Saccharomyces cerevisiae R008]EWG88694.1 hypothetical protein P301_O10501 [Saccharomyces cerevisiae P301]EWG93382.1 hypothetical protein R103_O10571 [Saccharomyces cerevisiae R103]CAY86206.1 EC1118_1O4_0870p [Saccharomyces cerevisiae EC1118]
MRVSPSRSWSLYCSHYRQTRVSQVLAHSSSILMLQMHSGSFGNLNNDTSCRGRHHRNPNRHSYGFSNLAP